MMIGSQRKQKPPTGGTGTPSRNSLKPGGERPASSLSFNPFRGFDELKDVETPRVGQVCQIQNQNGRRSCLELRPERREELIIKSTKREHKKVEEKKAAKVEQSELERLSFMLQQQRQRNLKLQRNMEELKKDFNEIKDQAVVAQSYRPPSDSRLSFKSVSDLSQQIASPNSKGDFSRTLETGRFGPKQSSETIVEEPPFGLSPVKQCEAESTAVSFQAPPLQDTSFGIQDYELLNAQKQEHDKQVMQRTFGRIESEGSLHNETEYDYPQYGESFAVLTSDKTFMSEMPIESSECLSQRQNEFRVEIKKGKKLINKPPLKAKLRVSQNKFKMGGGGGEKTLKVAAKCSQMLKQQALAQQEKKRTKKSQNSITSLKLPLPNASSKTNLQMSSEAKVSSPNKPVGMAQKQSSGISIPKFSSNSLKEQSSIKNAKRSVKSISTSSSKPTITISPASSVRTKLMPESASSRTLRLKAESFIYPPSQLSQTSSRQTEAMSTYDGTFSPTSMKQRENKNLMNVPPHHRHVWSGTRSMGSLLKHKHNFQFTGKVPKANMSRIRELAQCQSQKDPEYFYAREQIKPKNVEELKERLKEMQPNDEQYVLKKKYAFPMVVGETPNKRRQSQSYLVTEDESIRIVEEEMLEGGGSKKFKKYGSAKKSSTSSIPSLQSSLTSMALSEQLKDARIEEQRFQNQLQHVWNSKSKLAIPDGEEQKSKHFLHVSGIVRKEGSDTTRSNRVIKKIKSEVEKKIKNIYTD